VKEFGGFLPYGYEYSDQAMGIQETLKIKVHVPGMFPDCF
jgi:hypothetical protein